MADDQKQSRQFLLSRVLAHRFDADGATQTFEDRLARENGWTIGFARRAIEEYRRFAFLYAATDRPVAPPDIVDQVWHLHLLYTRNYWEVFCREVLGKPLHHEPAAGVEGEQPKFGGWYADTIARYREHFGDPPADIWPTPEKLANTPKPRHQRVDVTNAVVLTRRSALLLILAGVTLLALIVFLAARAGVP